MKAIMWKKPTYKWKEVWLREWRETDCERRLKQELSHMGWNFLSVWTEWACMTWHLLQRVWVFEGGDSQTFLSHKISPAALWCTRTFEVSRESNVSNHIITYGTHKGIIKDIKPKWKSSTPTALNHCEYR